MIQDWGHNPPALVSIALGANDAALESDPVHVPVDEYASNLRDMVRQIRTAFPTCMIMLVTPPTVDDATCIWPRSNEQAGVYAQMCVQVGAALNVSVVDVWSAFLHENQQNRTTVLHVPDGLHLNGPGNMLLHDLWLAQVHLDMPQLSPRHLPIVFS
ncbi:hypothetical protein DYB32_002699 [Aphanomyces invadans]|nr:hypothetical protein DYB32_002699 [Aphanomyces invadans]